MKTAIQRNLNRSIGLALLLGIGLSLSSCIIVDPYHRHHRHYRRPYLGSSFSQEVRP
ncbi:MAG: hypothetical protein ACJ76Y_02945 [Thermoanaerobaculia bacterium]